MLYLTREVKELLGSLGFSVLVVRLSAVELEYKEAAFYSHSTRNIPQALRVCCSCAVIKCISICRRCRLLKREQPNTAMKVTWVLLSTSILLIKEDLVALTRSDLDPPLRNRGNRNHSFFGVQERSGCLQTLLLQNKPHSPTHLRNAIF